MCYSCPVLYDDKVSRAACDSAIVRVCPPDIEHALYSVRGSAIQHVASAWVRPPSSMVFTVNRGGGMHGASPDLCQGIKGKNWK